MRHLNHYNNNKYEEYKVCIYEMYKKCALVCKMPKLSQCLGDMTSPISALYRASIYPS